jgi:hypothetical protein
MVQPENIDSGYSNSQLGDRSGCCHCNLAHLLIYALSESGFKTGQYPALKRLERFPVILRKVAD